MVEPTIFTNTTSNVIRASSFLNFTTNDNKCSNRKTAGETENKVTATSF